MASDSAPIAPASFVTIVKNPKGQALADDPDADAFCTGGSCACTFNAGDNSAILNVEMVLTFALETKGACTNPNAG